VVDELQILVFRGIVDGRIATVVFGIDLIRGILGIECLEGGIGILSCEDQ
jgi:hypothetical protein